MAMDPFFCNEVAIDHICCERVKTNLWKSAVCQWNSIKHWLISWGLVNNDVDPTHCFGFSWRKMQLMTIIVLEHTWQILPTEMGCQCWTTLLKLLTVSLDVSRNSENLNMQVIPKVPCKPERVNLRSQINYFIVCT